MIPALIPIVGNIIDKFIPDPEAKAKAKLELLSEENTSWQKELESKMSIIVAEAQGGSWIQRNWRPLTMLTFVGLIVARWLGFTAPGITPELESQLFDIIKIGIGGYIVGRSAEKVVKEYKQ